MDTWIIGQPHGPVDVNDIVQLREAQDRIDANHVWTFPHGTEKELEKHRAQYRLDRSAVHLLTAKIKTQMAQLVPIPRRAVGGYRGPRDERTNDDG